MKAKRLSCESCAAALLWSRCVGLRRDFGSDVKIELASRGSGFVILSVERQDDAVVDEPVDPDEDFSPGDWPTIRNKSFHTKLGRVRLRGRWGARPDYVG